MRHTREKSGREEYGIIIRVKSASAMNAITAMICAVADLFDGVLLYTNTNARVKNTRTSTNSANTGRIKLFT